MRISALSEDDADQYLNTQITLCGWAKTVRPAAKGEICFIELNDGSQFGSIQVVCDKAMTGFQALVETGVGSSYRFVGTLIESPGKQKYELVVKDDSLHSIKIYGDCPKAEYPLAAKKHKLETLRLHQHIRPRTNTIGAVTRVRKNLAFATHEFFKKRGFLYIHTPIITSADTEGAGELFQVSTLLTKAKDTVGHIAAEKPSGKVDYSKDFFKKPSFLTCSGQLNVEYYCCGVGDVYTFGPTFRAENSHTQKHLSEFWMIEPELAFADLKDDMDCAEEYTKYCLDYILKNNTQDIEFLNKQVSKGLTERL